VSRIRAIFTILTLFYAAASHAQTVEYIHTDALGTPVVVTDAARNIVELTEYEPFGAVLNRPIKDRPGYTGHVEDAATGLTYMQQRYYDPSVGRFLSVDPVAPDTTNGALFNRYMYAANNPHRFTDPDGRCTGSRLANRDGTCRSTGGFTTSTGPVGNVSANSSAIDVGQRSAGRPRNVSDPISNRRIDKLDERLQQPVRDFVNSVENRTGIRLRVVQGLRTHKEQDAMYAQGRTTPGSRVTNARGGESYHNYGLAIDVAGLMSDGSINWGINYREIEPTAAENGFEWGGRFKSIKDMPHFQMTFGQSISDLQSGGRP